MRKPLAVLGLIAILLGTGAGVFTLSSRGVAPQPAAAVTMVAAASAQEDEPPTEDGQPDGSEQPNGNDSGEAAEPAADDPSAELPDFVTVGPAPGSAVCRTTPLTVGFLLHDAMRYEGSLDTGTLSLTVDGNDVTGQAQVVGTRDFPQSRATLRFELNSNFGPGVHEVAVTFPDTDGEARTYAWSFDLEDADCEGVAGVPPGPQEPTAQPTTPPAPTSPPGTPGPGAPTQTPPTSGPTSGPSPSIQFGGMPASGILHLVLEENFRSTSQGEQNSRKELWLDLGNGNYRAVSREASGGSEIVVVRNGRTVAQLVPSDRRAFTQILPDDNAPQLNSVREQLLIHKQAAEQGGLTLLGEESASGRAALKVRPNGLPPTERVELWLDKDYGLLLREVISRRDGDAWEEVSNRGVSYPTIEVLTAVQAGEELFSTNVPPEYEQEITRLLTPVMAGTVRDLDLYWLGEQYGGMRAPYLIEQQVPGPRGAPVTLYSIAYTPAPSEPQSPPPDAAAMENQVTVINRLMSQEEITARERGERPPNSESVTVGGRRGIVINLQQDQQPSGGSRNAGQARPASSSAPNVVLDLTAGNTNIQILAKDRGRAVQAGEALVRLN